MNLLEKLEKLHSLFEQITPFCRAGSNPEVAAKIQEAEHLFVDLKTLAKLHEEEINALLAKDES